MTISNTAVTSDNVSRTIGTVLALALLVGGSAKSDSQAGEYTEKEIGSNACALLVVLADQGMPVKALGDYIGLCNGLKDDRELCFKVRDLMLAQKRTETETGYNPPTGVEVGQLLTCDK